MLTIAHRGSSGYEPENILSAFKAAVAFGVDMVELDVRTCKTGEAIVIHNKFIESKKIQLKNLSLSDIKRIYIAGNEHIPTLNEALKVIPKKVKVNIDLKDSKAIKEVVKCIEEQIKKGKDYEDFLITAYNPQALFAISAMDSKIQASLLIFFLPKIFIRLAAKFGNIVSIQLKLTHVSPKTVELAHNFGLAVFAWVANDPIQIKRLKEMGVDGIVTDFPDRI